MRNSLQKFLSLFLIILFFGNFSVPKIFAAEAPKCPFPHTIEIKSDEVIQKIDACIAARNNNTTATITEYNCPAGDFTLDDNQKISTERLAVNIATNVILNEVDKKMEEYMKWLQKIRSKDVNSWLQEYNSCIKTNAKTPSLEAFYTQICNFDFLSKYLNTNSGKKTIVSSSDAFPQVLCKEITDKKIKMWQFTAENLMTSAVSKSYQNDRDTFMEGVQGKYRSIIEKFHNYQKIIFRASSKITNFIREAVK